MPSKDRVLRKKKKIQYETKKKEMKTKLEKIITRKTCDMNIEKQNHPIIGQSGIRYNATNEDLNIVIDPQGYLEDIHMDLFFALVRSNSEFKPQCIAYSQAPERILPIPQKSKHIQILFEPNFGPNGIGHWIATYYDGLIIHVYDSLNSKSLHADAQTYLDHLFPFAPQIRYEEVQRQENVYDCGVFAIAFCTSILFGRNPEQEIYDNLKLRSHLMDMFKSQQLSQFPSATRQRQEEEHYQEQKLNKAEIDEVKHSKQKSDYMQKKRAIETENERIGRLSQSRDYVQKKREMETKAEWIKRSDQSYENKMIRERGKTNSEQNKKSENLKIDLEQYDTNKTNIKKNQETKNLEIQHEENVLKKLYEQKNEQLNRDNGMGKQQKSTKKSRVVNINKKSYKLAAQGLGQTIESQNLGNMDKICEFCHSRNFTFEMSGDKKFTYCCRKGKLDAMKWDNYPEYLRKLMIENTPDGRNFMQNIRQYNSALAFASMGARLAIPAGKGPFTFRIHGQIYHSTTCLYPKDGSSETYAQLYIIDTNAALSKRMNNECNKKCKPEIMKRLDTIIRDINPYYSAFNMLKEIEELEIAKARQTNQNVPEISLWLVNERNKDKRRYNIPTSNEVAIVFTSNDGEPPVDRDICIHPRGKHSIRINQFSSNCDPMVYPLLFPRGESGWEMKLKQKDGIKRQTLLQFYMNRLTDRNEFNPCLEAGKLTQQYVVDAYVKVEAERLTYIRMNQPTFRVELYTGLMDHINNLAAQEGAKPGTMIILPSKFQGGSRFMQKMYQNAMAIVREYGKPDLFITVTCNPKWREITENLRDRQTASDRPDLVARVFQGKIKSMLNEFLHEDIFGKVIAYVYVIEFQKRGLPHMHLLLTLAEEDKLRNKDDIDSIVCAEIPDEDNEPELYQIVKSHMIHGPCGNHNKNSPCMNDNKCSKNYPKDFREETIENVNGYPLYRRRNNNSLIYIYWPNGAMKYTVNNRWIVPYNPYLSKKYRTHINIEICSSVKSIKYICDYLCKGHDCASIKLGQQDKSKNINWDEIKGYEDTRYVSPPECMWRMLEYPLHGFSHTIFELAVHLKHQQAVIFIEGQEKRAVERAANKNTTLTAWFQLNQNDIAARKYRYMDIPMHYVFAKNNIWRARKRTVKPPIGRMISVSPKDIERFHLRLILINAIGATCFEDLRTVNGKLYNTFQEAARAKGLLANDLECENCLGEAVLAKFPQQLRELFAYLICFHTSTNVMSLWEKFKDYLMEDYLMKFNQQVAENKCLVEIQRILSIHRFHLRDFGLPEPINIHNIANDIDDSIDRNAEQSEANRNIEMFNIQQKEIYQYILNAVNDPHNVERYCFVDGPGGTGKTFLYNTIISTLRGNGLKTIAVAWTGIAATLLKGGQTVHSVFKLPVPINETSVCKIKANSNIGRFIRSTSLILWDEVTMAPCHALKALDTILQDLMNNAIPFGGKVLVLGGDFRQCLPIVKYTNHRTAIIEVCMFRSHLWSLFKKFSLKQNMRVNKNEIEFSKFLLEVGNGMNEIVKIPAKCLVHDSLQDEIFGHDLIMPDNIHKFVNRAILAPKNEDTMKLNELVLQKITGNTRVYYSADTAICEENNKLDYPTEVLNEETPLGMPPHKLSLKIGAIVMLLRNMNPKRGLCNGTRLIVKDMKDNYLNLEIVTGQNTRDRIFLPRIDLVPTDSNLPYILKRRQFPIRLAFSMTINKSQGQTFDMVGINLEKHVFTHGQLYVAMSRVRSFENLRIKLAAIDINKDTGDGTARNIVFKEILDD